MKKLALLTFYALLISLPTSELSAQSGTRPFGGRILGSPIYCTCSNGHVVNVGPPRPGRFHFIPGGTRIYSFGNVYTPGRFIPGGTRIYSFGNVYTPGRWLLGNYRPGTGNQCWIRVSHNSCIQVPNDGIMTIVGTS